MLWRHFQEGDADSCDVRNGRPCYRCDTVENLVTRAARTLETGPVRGKVSGLPRVRSVETGPNFGPETGDAHTALYSVGKRNRSVWELGELDCRLRSALVAGQHTFCVSPAPKKVWKFLN